MRGDNLFKSRDAWEQKALAGPDGAWIDVDGHAVAVRARTDGADGVKIIEYIHKWPENEPAPPPRISETDPRWETKIVERDGKLVMQRPEALVPRHPKPDDPRYEIELRPIAPTPE
jgi:hypothetical protein